MTQTSYDMEIVFGCQYTKVIINKDK